MQQIYLLEIFVDSVRVFVTKEEENSTANKNFCVKIGFGPKTEIFVREHQLNLAQAEGDDQENPNKGDSKAADEDLVTLDANGKRGWTRKVRVGKSFLFPSYSDTVLTTLRDFPLEIEVWNDDESEKHVFVASGVMRWDTDFFEWLQEEDQPDELHEAFCVKQIVPLKSECCCKIIGEINLILRLNAFGDSITTEFQATENENFFYFRSNKSPNVLHCERLEPFKDLNFLAIGPIHDSVNLEDPTMLGEDEVGVCTEFDARPCSKGADENDLVCRRIEAEKYASKIKNNKIRMGDITGPCGNPNCSLAHKVKMFLRKLDQYKEAAVEIGEETKDPTHVNVCGSCVCKQEHWHRDGCPEKCVFPADLRKQDVHFRNPTSSKLEQQNKDMQASYLLVDDKMKSNLPQKMYQSLDAQGNIQTHVCLSTKCQKSECPEVICNAPKNNNNTTDSSLLNSDEGKNAYLNYHDANDERCCKKCNHPNCKSQCQLKKTDDTENDEKQGMFAQNFVVQNVSMKYDKIYPKKPCSGCGCVCQMKKGTSPDQKIIKEFRRKSSTHEDILSQNTQSEKYSPEAMQALVKEIRENQATPSKIQPDRQNENRDRPNIFSQLVYKTTYDPKCSAVYQVEPLKHTQTTCDPKDDKECKCDPKKPTPPCRTFNCECLSRNIEYASRKVHKPYCPNYIHKENCPVNKTDVVVENEEEEEPEPEPLPYGLPPIQLGPCPVLGRPCSVPDGFARMYKAAAVPPQPPSWSDAGKICCSREFERIKKAIEEYMKYEKTHDMRCLNQFNIDTERRCCDKEQRLFALIGKGCCGSHKMALQEKYKQEKEKYFK